MGCYGGFYTNIIMGWYPGPYVTIKWAHMQTSIADRYNGYTGASIPDRLDILVLEPKPQ
jgi:hypothetical protein